MSSGPANAARPWILWVFLLLLLGAAIRLPGLSKPLLEGAAGKQTHVAMVARNLFRGHATFSRPRVDDVGKPGYFVKELPVVPALAALAYEALGRVDERVLRAIGIASWLAAAALLLALTRPALGPIAAWLAGAWLLLAPMGIVYSRSAMNDAPAVAGALLALWAVVRWRAVPTTGSAIAVGGLVAWAFLLKPHSAFWLGPAAAAIVLDRHVEAAPRPSPGRIAAVVAAAVAGLALASLWYLHAAAIHRTHPVPGATVAEGWVDPELLLRPDLYLEIGRQVLSMVFTPLGALVAGWRLVSGPAFSRIERAFLWWGAGSLLQALVFAPRMFDALSRGTEYYQLPLVATAAVLVGRGLQMLLERAREGHRALRAACAVLLVALAGGALVQARAATRTPLRYERILGDCAAVRAVTRPTDELVVLADRAGTILYYCARRGITFSLGGAVHETIRERGGASRVEIARALGGATHLYVPFPELDGDGEIWGAIGAQWREVPLDGSEARLFARPTGAGG